MKKQRTSEEMEQVIREYTLSGESVRVFCSRVGIAEHLLRYWMKRLEKGNGDIVSETSRGFSELKISNGVQGFSLILPHGLRLGIEGMAAQELAGLLLELDRQQDA